MMFFAEHAGPRARNVCNEAIKQFASRRHDGPAGVHRYISVLAKHFDDSATRKEFMLEAYKSIGISM